MKTIRERVASQPRDYQIYAKEALSWEVIGLLQDEDVQGLSFEEAITLKSFDCISRARGKKVRVTDIETGEIRYFNSLKESFESLGGNQTYSAIRYCFQKGKIYLNKFKIDRDM